MSGRTAEGAHLLFGLFLIAADLQVILQHAAQRQRDTCYCSHDLPSACIRSDTASGDLQFPLINLFLANGFITKRKQRQLKLGNEEVDGGWSALQLKNLPDVQLLELGEESQIVFSPGNFLSDNC